MQGSTDYSGHSVAGAGPPPRFRFRTARRHVMVRFDTVFEAPPVPDTMICAVMEQLL
jgi:hypothetical protein